jgi:hypothetical protein
MSLKYIYSISTNGNFKVSCVCGKILKWLVHSSKVSVGLAFLFCSSSFCHVQDETLIKSIKPHFNLKILLKGKT